MCIRDSLGGYRGATGLDPLVAGTIGATIVLFVTFAPSFLFIFAGAPFVERLRHNRLISGALATVTAAVVGVIANLAFWFGLHVLFREVGRIAWRPLVLPAPDPASFVPSAALIAGAALYAVLRLHAGVVWVLAFASGAGVLFRFLS